MLTKETIKLIKYYLKDATLLRLDSLNRAIESDSEIEFYLENYKKAFLALNAFCNFVNDMADEENE